MSRQGNILIVALLWKSGFRMIAISIVLLAAVIPAFMIYSGFTGKSPTEIVEPYLQEFQNWNNNPKNARHISNEVPTENYRRR